MPRIPGVKNVLDQPLWDTVQLAAAAGPLTYSFFLVPLGGLLIAGVNKGFQHTNMVQAGTLEAGSTYEMLGFTFFIRNLAQGGAAPTIADTRIVNGGHLNLLIGQVSYWRATAQMIPSAPGDAVLNDTATVNAQRGWPVFQSYYILSEPIDLYQQESLQVDLVIPGTIAAATDVTFYIHGKITRPAR